jgi:hypothetical protein
MKWTPGQTVVSIEFDDSTSDAPLAPPALSSHSMKARFLVNSDVLIKCAATSVSAPGPAF